MFKIFHKRESLEDKIRESIILYHPIKDLNEENQDTGGTYYHRAKNLLEKTYYFYKIIPKKVNEYEMGSKNILGLANIYTKTILLLKNLYGSVLKAVTGHEEGHQEDPPRSEARNDMYTNTGNLILSPEVCPGSSY